MLQAVIHQCCGNNYYFAGVISYKLLTIIETVFVARMMSLNIFIMLVKKEKTLNV